MTRYLLTWRSRITGREYVGKIPYATRAEAQADADFCNERYADIGMSYSVETVDDAAPAADTAPGEPGQGSAGIEQAKQAPVASMAKVE